MIGEIKCACSSSKHLKNGKEPIYQSVVYALISTSSIWQASADWHSQGIPMCSNLMELSLCNHEKAKKIVFSSLNDDYRMCCCLRQMWLPSNHCKAYHKDLKWHVLHEREMLGLNYQEIASNLIVHTSTVWRTVKKSE